MLTRDTLLNCIPLIPSPNTILYYLVLCLLCYSCLALQCYSTQLYPLSHPNLSHPTLLLYPSLVYSLAWRENWSTKQIPQQALLFPAESPGLGGMLNIALQYAPTYTMSSMNGTALSVSPGISPMPLPLYFYDILTVPSSHLPLPFTAHMCDRQNIRITVWADMVTWC